ncbi:MAG: tRNA-splicing ligase RtcB, partial [Limisphaerales bacterium]
MVLAMLANILSAPKNSLNIMNLVQLPVAVAGALMPDAHHGYVLPIGTVLGVKKAVIPYGVGLDI